MPRYLKSNNYYCFKENTTRWIIITYVLHPLDVVYDFIFTSYDTLQITVKTRQKTVSLEFGSTVREICECEYTHVYTRCLMMGVCTVVKKVLWFLWKQFTCFAIGQWRIQLKYFQLRRTSDNTGNEYKLLKWNTLHLTAFLKSTLNYI